VTSTNPRVTFPFGNTVKFPPLKKNGESTGSIRVALNGATGLEEAEFQISIVAPELQLPTGLHVTATHRVNYNEVAASSATETVESPNHGWTIGGNDVALPNVEAFRRRALSATQHVFFGPDNNGQGDDRKASLPDEQFMVSPVLQVGTAPFTISFEHRFAFEFTVSANPATPQGAWDGGVIEISTDGGATWVDIGAPLYNGKTTALTNAPIGANRPAFINRSANWPAFVTTPTLNLGTAYANQSVRIRFRIGADDSTGAPGWDIDNIVFSGLVNTPFTSLVGQTTICSTERQ
jgi:large repetitive protein